MSNIKNIVCTLLAMWVATVGAVAQTDGSHTDDAYLHQFASLAKAYSAEPDNIEVLYGLALFYFDNSHPMRSLPMAINYIGMAEDRYTTALQANRIKELSPLIKKGISLATIRQTRQAITQAAENTVKARTDMSADEIDLYLQYFPNNKTIVSAIRQRRIVLVYQTDLRRGTPEAYYHYIKTYTGTNEAEQMEARLAAVAQQLFANAQSERAVDAIAAQYTLSPSVMRAAQRRKSQIAYAEAASRNTVEAYTDFLSRYPSSDQDMLARERLSALYKASFTPDKSTAQYAAFAQALPDDEAADSAIAIIRRRITHEHDVEAARIYLSLFTEDSYYNDIFNTFYSWHSAEGSGAPIRYFYDQYTNYPLIRAVEDDLDRARAIDRIDLMEPFSEVRFESFANLLRQNMDRRIAYVILQRMLQQKIAQRNYRDALLRARQFEICFDNVCTDEYRELTALLASPTPKTKAVQELHSPMYNVLNPTPNVADGRLYFTRTERYVGSRICYSQKHDGKWGDAHEVKFINAEAEGLVLYGFYADGNQMLLGKDGDIWLAERDGDAWRISDIPPYPVNTDYIETDAYMLPDGSGMLVASDRPGGHNLQHSADYYHGDTALATDLYFIPYSHGVWGEAINLGAAINSPYCERSPLLSRNKRTLYFITDRAGLGYGDIYVATRSDASDWTHWSTPRNIGVVANSAFAESYVRFGEGEHRLYYSSNPTGDRSACYSMPINHDSRASQVQCRVDISGIEGYINRLQIADMAQQAVVQQTDDIADSSVITLSLDATHRYAIMADAGVFFVSSPVLTAAQNATTQLLGYSFVQLAAMSRPLVLPAVCFVGNELDAVSKMQLLQLAQFLKRYDNYVLEVIVHAAGDDAEVCYWQSVNRGNAVRQELINSGIDASALSVSACGNVFAMQGENAQVAVRLHQR